VARGILTRIQNYISGEHKLNEIQVRFTKLPDIFGRYDTAKVSWNSQILKNIPETENNLKHNFMMLKQGLMNCYIQYVILHQAEIILRIAAVQSVVRLLRSLVIVQG
jgi:hypothetical protein